jgi:short-subunit dehydrogenase
LLDEVAHAIGADTGVETRAVAVDLAEPDAMRTVADATAGLDVGMVMYNAGADPNYAPFLDTPLEDSLALVQRNCVVSMQMCHHFAAPMVARGAGGIVLVSSGGGLVGLANIVAYGATKAFDIVMAEALWAELHDRGVDVLALVLGATDTPSLRRLLVARGALDASPLGEDAAGPDDTTPIEGASTVQQVVDEAIANLANGPTWFVGEQLRQAAQAMGSMTRSDAVKMMVQHAGGIMRD